MAFSNDGLHSDGSLSDGPGGTVTLKVAVPWFLSGMILSKKIRWLVTIS